MLTLGNKRPSVVSPAFDKQSTVSPMMRTKGKDTIMADNMDATPANFGMIRYKTFMADEVRDKSETYSFSICDS